MALFQKASEKIPRRAVLGSLMFLACMFSYVIRTNLSINIVAMVEPSKTGTLMVTKTVFCGKSVNSSKDVNDYGPRYEWSEKVQGYLLAAYFVGVLPASIPAGMLAEKFGGARVVGFATLIPALLNLLVPLISSSTYLGIVLVAILRFFMGFFGGSVYPALHAMIAKWAPPNEKGRFVWTMQGGPFGAFVTFALCGYVIHEWGWRASYYVTSGLMLIFWALWTLLAYDTPDVHPTITEAEKAYIKEKIGTSVAKVQQPLPKKAVATSIPFLALMWAHFANMWGIYFISTNGPKYTGQVLGLNMKSGGFITGLPYIARLFAGALFASAGDFLRTKEILTLGWIRRIFMIFSHVGPALCLIGMTYAGCDDILAVSMMILALALNGAACQTSLQNHQDLAPNFAGSLYGIMNTFGSFPGFILPSLIGFLAESDTDKVLAWRPIFWISAFVFISATVIFWIFGSAQIQPWNDLSQGRMAAGADEEVNMKMTNDVEKEKEKPSDDEENERL